MSQDIILFAGLDVGDRKSVVHVIDQNGESVLEEKLSTSQASLLRFFSARPPMRIVLEVGTHSPWISPLLSELNHEVLVANARRLKAIYASDKKTDRVDAEMLARIGRLDPKHLHPIQHRGKSCQRALSMVRSREVLVGVRTKLINHVRGPG
jgi:transposase